MPDKMDFTRNKITIHGGTYYGSTTQHAGSKCQQNA
jgi:hypothetical protein